MEAIYVDSDETLPQGGGLEDEPEVGELPEAKAALKNGNPRFFSPEDKLKTDSRFIEFKPVEGDVRHVYDFNLREERTAIRVNDPDELKKIAQLKHENVTSLVNSVIDKDGNPYALFVRAGQNLNDWLKRNPSAGEVEGVLGQIAIAKDYLEDNLGPIKQIAPTHITVIDDDEGGPKVKIFPVNLSLNTSR